MVGRKIAGEYILVPIVGRGADVDAIFNLNGVGAFIWERLDGKAAGDVIVRALVERYEVDDAQAANDYRDFMSKLQTIQAVTVVSRTEAAELAAEMAGAEEGAQ
jgi:hypothetical protein